jgi:hypothetical protein
MSASGLSWNAGCRERLSSNWERHASHRALSYTNPAFIRAPLWWVRHFDGDLFELRWRAIVFCGKL